ncbi:unnamed protein product, partial [Amoebophrya sp. A25]|eukprot:GSA25T00017328001.1
MQQDEDPADVCDGEEDGCASALSRRVQAVAPKRRCRWAKAGMKRKKQLGKRDTAGGRAVSALHRLNKKRQKEEENTLRVDFDFANGDPAADLMLADNEIEKEMLGSPAKNDKTSTATAAKGGRGASSSSSSRGCRPREQGSRSPSILGIIMEDDPFHDCVEAVPRVVGDSADLVDDDGDFFFSDEEDDLLADEDPEIRWKQRLQRRKKKQQAKKRAAGAGSKGNANRSEPQASSSTSSNLRRMTRTTTTTDRAASSTSS